MDKDMYEKGMVARRRILGDAHVDRAVASATPLTADFQELISTYAWHVWTRGVLDDRTRRILVIGTMMAIGRWEEFDMHVRAALQDDFPLLDIRETVIQQGIYCGVPAANTAFHQIQGVIDALEKEGVTINKKGL
ncbi:MAG: carboxymuconolactone decarboxylase family protein [Alphaproteobacteria bacterium]|nr:carboxymuconolactone decarboxylase family protein [Alphaproteobacteria bacterium]